MMIFGGVYVGFARPGETIGPYTFTLQMFLTFMGMGLAFLGATRRGAIHAVIFVLFIVTAVGFFILVKSRQPDRDPPCIADEQYERIADIPEMVVPRFEPPTRPRPTPPAPPTAAPDTSPKVESPFKISPKKPNAVPTRVSPAPRDVPATKPLLESPFKISTRKAQPKPPSHVESTVGAAPSNPFLRKDDSETHVLGGTGGGSFRSVDPDGRPVVGLSYRTGSWGGEGAVGHLSPIYLRDESRGLSQTVMARDGYALGALEVVAGRYVNAVRPIFMRLTAEGQLDMADSYPAEWIGTPEGKQIETLGGSNRPVIGIYGRRAAILDAVGLLLGPSVP
jgi:hypothetical protein